VLGTSGQCTVPAMADRPVIAHLNAVWSSIDDLVTGLDDREWEQPTDCPGWTVRDQVSHLIGTESWLLGLPEPAPVDPAAAPHAHNPLGLANEAWVAERRDRSGTEVAAEFRRVTADRLVALRAMTDEQMAAETDGPLGRTPYRAFMEVRVMDCWVHEQDIRRALGRSGHFSGPAAEAAFGRLTASLGYVVGKRSEAPDGSTVVARLEGPLARDVAVQMIDGKARPVDPVASEPTVTLSMTAETYACLMCGRWSPADVVADGRVRISGDRGLAERILAAMSIMP
jgi:uncharacterized protein (TIGR03083 family)